MAQLMQVGNHKTNVYTEEGYTKVIYHETIVVKFNSGEVVLNSGGWLTNTTKARMNQTSNQYGLNYRVFQVNYKWFVEHNGKVRPFTDGMSLKRC